MVTKKIGRAKKAVGANEAELTDKQEGGGGVWEYWAGIWTTNNYNYGHDLRNHHSTLPPICVIVWVKMNVNHNIPQQSQSIK